MSFVTSVFDDEEVEMPVTQTRFETETLQAHVQPFDVIILTSRHTCDS